MPLPLPDPLCGSSHPISFHSLKILFIYILFFGCAGSFLPHGFFSSCRQQGLLSSCSAQASHYWGFSCCRAWALWHVGLVFSALGLQNTSSIVVLHGFSFSTACGIFQDQELNPCLLHWHAVSLPLSHQLRVPRPPSPHLLTFRFLRCKSDPSPH